MPAARPPARVPGRHVTDGYQLGFEIAALFCLAGALVAVLMLREGPERVGAVAPELEFEDVEKVAA